MVLDTISVNPNGALSIAVNCRVCVAWALALYLCMGSICQSDR